MKRSLDTGFPTLLRLENELEWILAVGYDADTIYGLDSQFHSLPDNWHSMLRDAIVITGNTAPDMSCKELLERIASALSYDEHTALEGVIMDVLDHVTMENAMDTAGMMCGIISVPIEARWHAAEAFIGAENLLCDICTNKEIHSRLSDVFLNGIPRMKMMKHMVSDGRYGVRSVWVPRLDMRLTLSPQI